MTGRVALESGIFDLTALKAQAKRVPAGPVQAYQVQLSEEVRGKVVVGETTILFQFVALSPVQPKPQLPPSVIMRYSASELRRSARRRAAKTLPPGRARVSGRGLADHDIAAGANWWRETETKLKTADAALLLLSSDYFDNDRFHDSERPILMRRQDEGTLLVIPVVLRACAGNKTRGLGSCAHYHETSAPSDRANHEIETTCSKELSSRLLGDLN